MQTSREIKIQDMFLITYLAISTRQPVTLQVTERGKAAFERLFARGLVHAVTGTYTVTPA